MRKRRVRNFALRVEQLESRRMLAGNVAASRQGDTLVVRGDNASNEIGIFSDGSGEYTVTGGGTTTVNGDVDAFFTGIRNISIDLRGGNDILAIADDPTGLLDVPANVVVESFPTDLDLLGPTTATPLDGFLFIRTGAGNDEVGLAVDTGLHVDIGTGAGNDEVVVLGSDVGTHLFVRTEAGADEVAILDSFVDTTLLVDLGNGFDAALLQTVDADQITVNGGRDGDDIGLFDIAALNHIIVTGGHGNDTLEVEFAEASYMQLNGGEGSDELDADGNDVFGTLHMFGGGGNDSIEVEPTDDYLSEGEAITFVEGAILIDGGAGSDSLEAELTESDSLTIIGGGGNDELDADGVLVHGSVVLVSGAGNDDVDVGASDDEEFNPDVDSVIEGLLHVILGSGNDEAFVENSSIGQHLLIDAGSGNDFVQVENVDAVDFVLVLMGSGDDDLEFFNVAGSREELDGGPGFDELLIDFTNGRTIRNFEDIFLD